MLKELFEEGGLRLTDKEAYAFEAIMSSDLKDIVGLIAQCGYDTKSFFMYGSFDGMDFRGSDVRDVSFRGASLAGAVLYIDQYDLVKLSDPRSLEGVNVVDRTEGDRPPSSSLDEEEERSGRRQTSLEAFLQQLGVQKARHEETSKIDFSSLSEIVRSMDGFETRMQAFGAYLHEIPVLPAKSFIDLVYKPDENVALERLGTSSRFTLATAIIQMFQTTRFEDRMSIFNSFHSHESTLNVQLENLAASSVRDVAELKELMSSIDGLGFSPTRNLFWGAARKIKFNEIPETLGLMRSVRVAPDIGLFKSFSQSSRSFGDRMSVLHLMLQEDIAPDASFFKNLAEVAKSPTERQRLLEAMRDTRVEPDAAFYQSFVQSAG
ncbi:MAG: hypothetical protein WAU16_14660, partial [Rhizobiaceae bacterium]